MNEVKVIKRYQNRKLYDTHQSCYVTLEEISQMIKNGDDLLVAQPLNVVALLEPRRPLPRLEQGHSSGTLATDVIEKCKIVLA